MLIAGAGGQGKEILGILLLENFAEEIAFYDEGESTPQNFYGKFRVLKAISDVEVFFNENGNAFIVGVGQPRLREKLTLKLEDAGGELESVIASKSTVFPLNNSYKGIVIQPGAAISHGVSIEKGCILHCNTTIGHEAKIGKYVGIGPNSSVIGPVSIGDYCQIGANVTVLPNLKIGKQVIIGAGSVVDRNLADHETFVGIRTINE